MSALEPHAVLADAVHSAEADAMVQVFGIGTGELDKIVDNFLDNADAGGGYEMEQLHDGGVNFILTEMPPVEGQEAFMHATDTIDYLAVMSGEITMVLETEEVVLRAGDLIVDRGIVHGWRNDGSEVAVMVSVTVPALPVGKGRTV